MRLMSVRTSGVWVLVMLLAGCSSGRTVARPTSTATPADSPSTSPTVLAQPTLTPGCPPPKAQPGGGYAAVDYVDFLQANGRNYISGLVQTPSITNAQLGRAVLKVRCSYAAVSGSTGQVFGQPRDGDAAYLAPGTTVFEVRGWPITCRLAAVQDHRLHVYLAYQQNTRVATAAPCALRKGY